jgi:FAD synthase
LSAYSGRSCLVVGDFDNVHRGHPGEGDRERHVERAPTSYWDGSFMINRLGAEAITDQDLAPCCCSVSGGGSSMITANRQRAIMLIDRTVAAYQDFI